MTHPVLVHCWRCDKWIGNEETHPCPITGTELNQRQRRRLEHERATAKKGA